MLERLLLVLLFAVCAGQLLLTPNMCTWVARSTSHLKLCRLPSFSLMFSSMCRSKAFLYLSLRLCFPANSSAKARGDESAKTSNLAFFDWLWKTSSTHIIRLLCGVAIFRCGLRRLDVRKCFSNDYFFAKNSDSTLET